MAITTFTQRQKAEYIYNTYFKEDSEHLINFGLFDTINFYGALKDDKIDVLDKEFKEMGEKLFQQIKNFDENEILKNKVLNKN